MVQIVSRYDSHQLRLQISKCTQYVFPDREHSHPSFERAMHLVILLGAFILPFTSSFAQSGEPLVLPYLSSPIILDGLSDEQAWVSIPPLELTVYEPTFRDSPTEYTEIRVAYDEHYLFVAARMYDDNPAGIRMNTLYRDGFSGDDLLEIILDSFNDNENAIIFGTTPAGVRRDAAVSNDFDGGLGALNRDYNTFWDVETVVNEEGWFAEMRIPFSSLRFQDEDGRVIMGLTIGRLIARKFERHIFPAISPSIASYAFIKPSLAQKVVFENLRPRKPLYVTPYGIAGLGQSYALNETASAYARDDHMERDLGLDLKYGLTNNLVMDLSVNTDFAQAEADDQMVNLTRFSLFFPEKRLFFQERAGIFNFRTGGSSRLFHSRRIGLAEDGSPVPLLGGARISGRMGRWDVGFLDMQSAAGDNRPSENMGVIRLRRQMLNPYSYAGTMLTSRIDTDGSYNMAFGVDGVFRVFGDDYLTFVWAQTFEKTPSGSTTPASISAGRIRAEWEKRTREGLSYRTSAMWSGPDYNPGLGFIRRRNYSQFQNTLSYGWLPGVSSALQWHAVSLIGTTFVRNEDTTVESVEFGPVWHFTQKSGSSGAVAGHVLYEYLRVPFRPFSNIEIPAGRYTFLRCAASYTVSWSQLLRGQSSIEAGSFYDGWSASVGLSPTWSVSKHLELSASYQYNRIRFPVRDQEIDTHLARIRIQTALNVKVSLHAFLQYNHTAEALTTNVRFRYNFREGTDLWIVYNEGINTERDRFTPALPLTDTRTLIVKYTHTFTL